MRPPRLWINNDIYLPGDFREKIVITQSPKLDDICLIVEEKIRWQKK